MGNKIRKRKTLHKAPKRTRKSRRSVLTDSPPVPGRLEIIVDTREQKPLWSSGSIRQAMNVGDYTTVRLEKYFCVERKSGSDLYSSIIHNHARFMRELNRALRQELYIAVYVECTKKDFIHLKWAGGEKRKMLSITLERIINTVVKRRNLEIVWCKDRDTLRKKVYRRLLNEEKVLKKL